MRYSYLLVALLASACSSSDSGNSVVPEDFCAAVTCANDGLCVNMAEAALCLCTAGFAGDLCGTSTMVTNCASDSCANGECLEVGEGFACLCVEGYSGDTCATNVDDCALNLCENGGACVDGVASTTCSCAAGYDGELCANDIDDCGASPCSNGGVCLDQVDAFLCDCLGGFAGPECSTPLSCTNLAGSFSQDFTTKGNISVPMLVAPRTKIYGNGVVSVVSLNGLGIGASAINNSDVIRFEFDALATDVRFSTGPGAGNGNGNGVGGEARIEGFDSAGGSLGFFDVNSTGSRDVSAAFGGTPMTAFSIRSIGGDSHFIASLNYTLRTPTAQSLYFDGLRDTVRQDIFNFDGVVIESSSTLLMQPEVGLGIVGSTFDSAIDGDEAVRFDFAAGGAQGVSYVVRDSGNLDGDGVLGAAEIQAFAENGDSLGTVQVSGDGVVDISALFGYQPIGGFEVKALSDDHIITRLFFRRCLPLV